MAGEDASEEVLRDIAKSLMGTLSGGTGRTIATSETQLRDFMDHKIDLDPAIKTQLARYFYTNATHMFNLRANAVQYHAARGQ